MGIWPQVDQPPGDRSLEEERTGNDIGVLEEGVRRPARRWDCRQAVGGQQPRSGTQRRERGVETAREVGSQAAGAPLYPVAQDRLGLAKQEIAAARTSTTATERSGHISTAHSRVENGRDQFGANINFVLGAGPSSLDASGISGAGGSAFMFAPTVNGWPHAGCPGCSMLLDNIGQFTPVHLKARGVSLAVVSLAPLANIEAYRKRMSWAHRWVSSANNSFNADFGLTTADGELSVDVPLAITYDVWCPLPGVARFEGLRVEMTDLQGFFCHVTFLRDPVVMRILGGGSISPRMAASLVDVESTLKTWPQLASGVALGGLLGRPRSHAGLELCDGPGDRLWRRFITSRASPSSRPDH